jgi:hypothetical protein
MAININNAIRARSIITVTGNTATSINLSNLSTNTQLEIVTAAAIAQVISSSDGFWRIYRGDNASGTLVLELQDNNNLPFSQTEIVVSNGATSNIYVTNSGTGGTLILALSKTATYTSDLDNI